MPLRLPNPAATDSAWMPAKDAIQAVAAAQHCSAEDSMNIVHMAVSEQKLQARLHSRSYVRMMLHADAFWGPDSDMLHRRGKDIYIERVGFNKFVDELLTQKQASSKQNQSKS
jgi:hypothetical protein